MFDSVLGLPLHPLVVHAVVVLVPLSALLVITIAVVPRWRATLFGWFVVGLTAIATMAVPVATQSGQALAQRVGEPERHAELGEALVYLMLPLLVLVVAMVLLAHRRPSPASPGGSRTWLPTTLAAVAALVAVGALVQVALVGHSGAEATWGNVLAVEGG